MKKAFLKLFISALSALFCFAGIELAVRLLTTRNADGDLYFRMTRLKPYHLPANKVKTLIDEYSSAIASAKVVYDPELGWVPQADRGGANDFGFFSANPHPGKTPESGCFRIALFGGSYTKGGANSGWWKVMEKQIAAYGMKAEVMNFGVGGYAMDQSYLRWKQFGVQYHPDLVVFGFAASNSLDNINILRLLKEPFTEIPFTKPRFLLNGDSLKLTNSPTPAPDVLPQLIAASPTWPILQQDYCYVPADYQARWWRTSRVLGLIEAKAEILSNKKELRSFYKPEDEPARLALKLVQQFKNEVELVGSKFLVIHLPAANELSELRRSGSLPYAELYSSVQKSAPVIQPEQKMLEVIGKDNPLVFFNDGHYSEKLHETVGSVAASYITSHYSSKAAGGN